MFKLTVNRPGHKFYGAEFIITGEAGHPFLDHGYGMAEALRAGVKRPVAGIILGIGQPQELMATFSAEELMVDVATIGAWVPRNLPAAMAVEFGWTVADVEGAAQDLHAELGWDDVDWQDYRTGEIHGGIARRLREAHGKGR